MLDKQSERRRRMRAACVDAITDWLLFLLSYPILISFIRIPYLFSLLAVNGHMACIVPFFAKRTHNQ